MMFRNRQRSLVIFFIILAGITLYFLSDRMIIGREKFVTARYTDKQFIELMERLISEDVFEIGDGEIVMDEKNLSEKNLRKKTVERIKNSLSYLYMKNGKIHFDRQSVSIAHTRSFTDERILRGSFLDRNGVVLASSIVDEKLLKQDRHYTFGPAYYPIIGHNSPVYGKRNLEKVLDEYLSGKLHSPIYRKTSEPLKKLEIGDDVILTIDSNIQNLAYSLMEGKKGAVVALNVKTGEILSAVSTPSFDPNTKERAQWRESFSDNSERPYENRVFSVLYPPGSTFKTVVSSAWLEKNDIEKNYAVICTGKRNKYDISDIHVHGKENFDKAYVDSCNVFFSEIGVMLGQSLLDYAERFGFNKDINLIPQVKGYSYYASRSLAFSWHKGSKNEIEKYTAIDFRRNPKIIAQGAIGQNLITATPLQMALVAATIANRGIVLNPYIVKEIRTGDGKKVLFSAKPVETGRVVKAKTAIEIMRLMEDVMVSGTGKDVRKIYFIEGKYTNEVRCQKQNARYMIQDAGCRMIRVAGKTGTAEIGDKNGNGIIDPDEKPHSWFIGFAPADNPRVAIAVIAENQGFGSLTAAPIAMNVLAEALNAKVK